MATAQRCQACDTRFWMERKPKPCCPKCGGELLETEERRRKTQAGFATRKAAEAAMCKVMTAVEERSYVVPTRITVREYLLREWLPAIRGTVRPTTFSSYATHVEGHIVPALGSLQLSRLSAQAINAFYARLLENGRLQGKGSLSPATVRRVHATLHRALKDAVRWQRLSLNPADAADPPRGKSKERDLPAWNAEQLAGFLCHVKDDRLFALWRLLSMTGCRRGEALGLAWDDLDLEANTITIRRALVPLGGHGRGQRTEDAPAAGGGSPSTRSPLRHSRNMPLDRLMNRVAARTGLRAATSSRPRMVSRLTRIG